MPPPFFQNVLLGRRLVRLVVSQIETPCCKHSPSSISMLLRIVRKGGRLYTQPGRFIPRRDCSSLTQLQSQMNVFHSELALHAITDSLLNLCPLNDIPFKLSNVGCCWLLYGCFFHSFYTAGSFWFMKSHNFCNLSL